MITLFSFGFSHHGRSLAPKFIELNGGVPACYQFHFMFGLDLEWLAISFSECLGWTLNSNLL